MRQSRVLSLAVALDTMIAIKIGTNCGRIIRVFLNWDSVEDGRAGRIADVCVPTHPRTDLKFCDIRMPEV
jgi:hypothetical protein